MPRTKLNGEQDKRSETSQKNVAKARAKLSHYVKKARALRDTSDEDSESDQELVITHKPRKVVVKQKVESESEDSEVAPQPKAEPLKPRRCHSTKIDELRQQLLELRGQLDTARPPPAKERDPVVH